MRSLTRLASIVALLGLSVGLVYAANQTILGKQGLIKDPKPGVDATKRRLVGGAREVGSPNVIVGNPMVGGAVITFFGIGATSSNQAFVLPPSKWSPSGTTGYKYKDALNTSSAIKTALIKRSNGGLFTIKATGVAKFMPINVVPPNPGTGVCMRLDIIGGDSYHVLLATGATIKKNTNKLFMIKNATSQGVCPGTPTTTTTSTSSTSTTSTSTTIPYGSPSRAFVSPVRDLLD